MDKTLNSLLEDFKDHVSTSEGKEQAFKILSAIDKIKMFGISEALIHTYDPNKIEKYIKKYFKLEDWQYRIIKARNNVTVLNIVILPNNRIEDIKRILDQNFGWYFTNKFDWKAPNGTLYYVLEFRPKFSNDDKIQELIKKYPLLWHVTPISNYKKIMKQGFVPKSKNTKFEYPSKIHFLPGNFSLNDAINCYNTIYRASSHKDEDWVILKVDVRKDNGDIPKFYWDPDYEEALYTYENIPSDKVKLVQTIKPRKKRNLTETIEFINEEFKKLDTIHFNYKDW